MRTKEQRRKKKMMKRKEKESTDGGTWTPEREKVYEDTEDGARRQKKDGGEGALKQETMEKMRI